MTFYNMRFMYHQASLKFEVTFISINYSKMVVIVGVFEKFVKL